MTKIIKVVVKNKRVSLEGAGRYYDLPVSTWAGDVVWDDENGHHETGGFIASLDGEDVQFEIVDNIEK